MGSYHLLPFLSGMLLMGVAHAVITVKGTHLASHGALSESQAWSKVWAVFFIEVSGNELSGSETILQLAWSGHALTDCGWEELVMAAVSS